MVCGESWVCGAMKTGVQRAGSRVNFNQKTPLAGFVTSCVAVLWNGMVLV